MTHDDNDEATVKRFPKKPHPDDLERVSRQARPRPSDPEQEKKNRWKEPALFYAALLKQIERAKKNNVEKLDLSGGAQEEYQLSLLPVSLYRLSNLRSLDLSNNQLTELPDNLKQLSELESINLSHNRLTSFPKVLNRLPNLRSISLAGNGIAGSIDALDQLKHLEFLNLSANGLNTLPESLSKLTELKSLNLSRNILRKLPSVINNLTNLEVLDLSLNTLEEIPETIGLLLQLQSLDLSYNSLTTLPESLVKLLQLRQLDLRNNKLMSLFEGLGNLIRLRELDISYNQLSDLPATLAQLDCFHQIQYQNNPFNLELDAAYKEGRNAVKRYLLSKAAAQITLNEAKLILVGEGEVGKTCLMDALLGHPWKEHDTTHGIEIQQIKVAAPDSKKEITLNSWDFGGQRVYRPTHQLFFSAPAVYLVIWKPREGPQQGFVKEWIQLIKRREPTARILVVATHGGPQQRQPDIDRQELWDLFGKETVVDFFFVDSKPDENGNRKGIRELKVVIARIAAELPEVGRSVPKSFQEVREALQQRNVPYLPLDEVLAICREHKMDDEIARLFIAISHRLGHLTHYQNDPALRDIVILRPDWLATAMSYVLDDEETRKAHGLVKFSRLSQLWNDSSRQVETRYPEKLHRVFLRLMERFDLSYRVVGVSPNEETDPVSLIAQLVPDTTPEEKDFEKVWLFKPPSGDIEQTQICRIVDAQNGQSANAEGLFYQLIVRLHKYSLGRENYYDSVHWQRGLVLDANYNGRALLRHIGNDIHITVRAPYPERFLAMLTEEVKYLVESFWEGLRCDVTVPCLNEKPCSGLFEVSKLIENKRRGRPEQPCPICNEWQSIDQLLSNAPAATQPISLEELLNEFASVKGQLTEVNVNTQRILSQVDKNFADFIKVYTDEAKEGPRLFSLVPVDRSNFNPQKWIRAKFKLTLWCEHSRRPLPELNDDKKKGVYEVELDREWFKKAAPYLKWVTGTLSLVLPVVTSGIKWKLDDQSFKAIEEELDFGKSVIDASISEGTKIGEFMGAADKTSLEHGESIRADGATLRELHALLKAKDPGFGGLIRVTNKRQEFLWVHEKFASEY